ncbi:MAG: hypothetical protein E7647_04075 [Ruminococcaceae bacterium]|nr:hypothetical protein [Oscillospiraceae bacterium]
MNTKAYTLNGSVYTFDPETGALLSIELPGTKPMMAEGKGLFDLAWPVHLDYDIQRANPTALYGRCAPTFEYSDDELKIVYEKVAYTMPCDDVPEYEGGISATVTLKPLSDGRSVSMRLQLKNNSKAPIEQILFPDMNGIVPTDTEENEKLTMMGGAMKPFVKLKNTAKSRENFFAWTETTKGIFMRAGGLQQKAFIGRWYDIGSRKGGFSMYRRHWGWGPDTDNNMGYDEQLWIKLDNKVNKLRLASVHTVKVESGAEYDSGEYVITPHKGDWLRGVTPYREYVLENQHRVLPVPKRVKEMMGFRTIFMANGYPKHPTDYSWKYDDFETIADDMLEHGLSDLNVWGQFNWNLPFGKHRFYSEWGGFENWKKNADKIRAKGVTITPLVSWISAWEETARFLGIEKRSGSWAETPEAIPMFAAPYCDRWGCFQMHDHSNETWKEEIRKGLRFLRDECGCPDICWDQYVLGDNRDDSIRDIIHEYRLETEKLYPGTAFSSESTLYYESDIDNTDFTWNWIYWSEKRDYRPYLHIVRTLRPNMNVDSTPEYVKLIFMDNLMMNVYPSHPEEYNGGALIAEYPEFSEAVKTCARLRREYLSYFVDGVMVSDCPLTEDSTGRLTGYLKEDEGKLLLINYRAADDENALSLDLSDFLKGDKFTYIVKDEDGNTVHEGETGAVGTVEYKGEAGKLYMIEIG